MAGTETFFGLPGKLGIVHFCRQHVAAFIPNIVRRQFYATGYQIAKFTEFPHRRQKTASKTVYVGAALRCRNKVDIAFGNQLPLFGQPHDRPGYDLLFAFLVPDEGYFRNSIVLRQIFKQIVLEAILEIPGIRLAGMLIRKGNRQAGA